MLSGKIVRNTPFAEEQANKKICTSLTELKMIDKGRRLWERSWFVPSSTHQSQLFTLESRLTMDRSDS